VALNSFSKDVTANITSAANSIAGAASASSTDVHKMSLAFSEVSAVANNFQQSIDMTSTALAVLAQGGIQSGQAGTALKTMLQRLNPSTKEARQTMMELGLMTRAGKSQFTDAAGNYKSLAEISQLLQNSLKGLSQESQNIAMERLFGSESIKAALVFANKGAKGFADMKAEMTKFTVASIAADKLNNFNGALEMLMGTIDTILIQVGQLFLPALTMLTQVINIAANAFQSFIGTNVGKFFAIAAAGVTTLVVVFGAFIPLIRTTSTVFYVMTLAARQSLIAFLPYLPVVAAVTAVVVTVMTAMKAFRGVLEENEKPATGLWGVMQRLGAVLWSVGQIVDSWNGKSFDLGGNEAKLQALGMLDTIRAVGTYVVRFVEFFKGVGAGVYSVFASVAGAAIRIYNVVVQAVNGFMRAIGMQSAMLKFSSSDVQTWITVGKTLGYIIGTVLVVAVGALTISLGSMAIAVIAATWPILAVIAAVSAVVAVFYYWDDIVAWFSSGWQKTMKSVQDYAARLATYFDKQFSKDLSAAFIYLAHNAPVWIGKAVNFIVSGILQIVPIMIKAWFDFGVWFMDALPKIAMQATEGAGTYFADFVWWAIGKFIDFQWWLLENVPYMLLSAFMAAFTFVANLLGQFIWNIGKAFWDMGVKAGNALWDGLKSVWSKLVEWWNTAMQSLGIDSLVVNAEQNVKTNKTNELIGSGLLKGGALELSTQMAQGKAQQINFLSPMQPEVTQTAPQEVVIHNTMQVDGETLAATVERVLASREARK
jgi:TP901 family phage tail tape measure protein